MVKINKSNMNKKEKRAAAQAAAAAQNGSVETPTATEPKRETMAAFLDRLIGEGKTLEEIAAAAKEEAEKRGDRTKYNKGTIQGHIKFREKQIQKKAQKAQKVEEKAEVEE